MSEYHFGAMESANTITEAVQNQNTQELCMLIEKGGHDLNKQDKMGRTVLFVAACRGNSEMCKILHRNRPNYRFLWILLENGADATILDRNGNSPLHWSGHCEVIELLVNYGGDVYARNKAGLLPRQMAVRRGASVDAIQYFEQLERLRDNGRKESLSVMASFFREMYAELGLRYTMLFVLGLLFIVLYITITITGLSRHFQSRDPIIVETQNIKF